MPSMCSRRRAAAIFSVAAAVLLAGCTAEKKDDATGTPSSGGPSVAAVAPGVTADSIKIGIAYPDLEAVKDLLKVDHGDYEATYNALIKKINDAGGINGRKIVPVFGAINVISPAAAQETCVKLTQDEKVFAVVGTFNGEEPLCYVQTQKTAIVGGDLTAKNYGLAQAPWFSFGRGGDEVGDGVAEFKDALTGKKVAIVGTAGEQPLIKEILVPALQRLGVTPVETGVYDGNARDTTAMVQQSSVFMQKFQAAGADTVVVVGGASSTFATQLERTAYRPQLLFTSAAIAETYTGEGGKHDYSTLNNALALGPVPQWNEPEMQACVATVEEAIPDLKGKVSVDPATLPQGSPTPQGSVMAACRNLALFKAIVEKAGKDLNYQTFQEAGFSLGELTIPGYRDKAEFTRDTPHGAVPARLWKYDPNTGRFAAV